MWDANCTTHCLGMIYEVTDIDRLYDKSNHFPTGMCAYSALVVGVVPLSCYLQVLQKCLTFMFSHIM